MVIQRPWIGRIQESVGTVLRLVMPYPWRLWTRIACSDQLSKCDPTFPDQETFPPSSAKFQWIQQDWEFDQESNLCLGHYRVERLWTSPADQKKVFPDIKIRGFRVSWAVCEVSCEEDRSFASHRERGANRDWVFPFHVGSFHHCGSIDWRSDQWGRSVFAVHEESAEQNARVSPTASECHYCPTALCWSPGLLHQNPSSRWHGINPYETAFAEAWCQGQDML